jgi:Co/Zn/Cd efflux system component
MLRVDPKELHLSHPHCDDCSVLDPKPAQRSALTWVLVINALMFAGVLVAALIAGSSSMLSGTVDNLGDAITYALSLWAVSRGVRAKARVALFKGLLILLAALLVTGHVAYKFFHPSVPVFELMGIVTAFSLLANGLCLAILRRHRGDDINMTSVWECSRNDVIENLAVLLSAVGVWITAARWPDTVVALVLIAILYRSAIRVIRRSLRELR